MRVLVVRIVVVVAVVTIVGCGGGQSVAPGTDGGSGGARSGGAPGTGGSTSSGGAGPSGGMNGTGGASSGGAGGGTCASVPIPEGGDGKICADILIDTAAAATAAQDCTEATGGVTISPFFAGTVELPRLRKVGKDVRRDGAQKPMDASDPAQTTRVLLPNVTEIGGDVWFYLDQNLVELDLRSVKTIVGRAWVYRDTLIRKLRLDALQNVGMDFYVGDTFELPECMAKDIASHVTAGQTSIVGGTKKLPANCHCEAVCGHVEELCP